ncbi:nucleotide 5'-monophosphate nucleosidase PpnN [Sansalvadorimonas sp. 2012CJ34-2]|uniref:AMP nucleosidase n=1 Tax=Parendozoicomonas callyspongiae TaxID=2942213 RepID=A0ABT0PJE5_9GAMM|nr:nucleotide 5'-monophosphate nucleosidase PpnN [Sansalvadorimonas sp. 2012CJ34-2]MCL6271510.1 nucleotide 5'-monophosphate nucleosidase PpnN [Sansalvadorimonas sp. 2012CJ34-2]
MSGCNTVSAIVNPAGSMNVLSAHEVSKLHDTTHTGLYSLFRQCALAVLSCDTELDDAQELMNLYHDFDIKIMQEHRGLQLELINAPACAFVNGELIRGVRENLFSVVRDILHVFSEIEAHDLLQLTDPQDITNLIFEILRHANAFIPKTPPNIVVCWGGHSIGREEYKYTKDVGYQLGLRGMDICTGCGPGAMKGPMKGGHIGHAKQRIHNGRFIGLTEPGIIAAESPNPIVNELLIMPDIEKRLESFVRLGHGIVVFPGGPGTCEEIMYLIGILLHPANRELPFPFILTGPACAKEYFEQINAFIGDTLGAEAQKLYEIIVDDPVTVANRMQQGLHKVKQYRKDHSDAFYFNWKLHIEHSFQEPFEPTHENMAALALEPDLPKAELAANLRRAMSGIVAGNIKEDGVEAIRKHGKFKLKGEPKLMKRVDKLLASFVEQQRMKLPGSHYEPCYEIEH